MTTQEIHARVAPLVDSVVREVGLPSPWDINVFLDRLERYRGGRPIDLCGVRWTAGQSSGAWRAYADHDVIAYSTNTSGLHQDAIILHEIGHMLPGHRGRCILSDKEALALAPDLAPAAFAHLLDRVNSGHEEQEAETFATMIVALIARQRPPSSGIAARVERTFG